jgi:type I restriction enzyme S subunit
VPDLARLGDHVDLLTGNPFKSADYTDSRDGVRLLRGDNVAQGRIRWDNAKYWPAAEVAAYARYQLQAGDVILAMDRPWIEAGLKYAELRPADVPSLLVQRVACLRALPTLDQRFLACLVGSPAFTAYVLGVQTGTAVPHISGKQIQDFEFALPSLRDQRAIGELLGGLDDKIAVNCAMANVASGLGDAWYARVIAGATGDERIGDLIELKYGKALPAAERMAGEFPVYGSGGLAGSHETRLVDGPGVIVGRKGTVGAVYWTEQGFFPIDTTFYVEVRRKSVPMEFVFYLLKHLGLEGMNSDSAVPGLNRSSVLALEARVPGESVLRQFHEDVRPLFLLRESLSTESAALVRLRDALSPRLMSGEVRIKDAAKAIGDVALRRRCRRATSATRRTCGTRQHRPSARPRRGRPCPVRGSPRHRRRLQRSHRRWLQSNWTFASPRRPLHTGRRWLLSNWTFASP